MRIIRDYRYVDPADRGASAAIGNFDGVHLGHQAVIRLAIDEARRLGCPSGVVTFEPHPRQVFAPGGPPFRLMNAEARAHRLEQLGIERLYELTFHTDLSQLSPEAFAREVLSDGLGLAHVVVGEDFHFGKGRAGRASDLEAFGSTMGFGVTICPLLETNGIDVSSTRIRKALSEGRPQDAAAMLGHLHRIEGEVIRGDQRGRDLGYPTANLALTELHTPRLGVYAVTVRVLTGPHAGEYGGVAALGVRPMFGADNAPNLETFLFDFQGDLYGEHLSVGLMAYIRPEVKFESLDALIAQMNDDSAKARAVLAEGS